MISESVGIIMQVFKRFGKKTYVLTLFPGLTLLMKAFPLVKSSRALNKIVTNMVISL